MQTFGEFGDMEPTEHHMETTEHHTERQVNHGTYGTRKTKSVRGGLSWVFVGILLFGGWRALSQA